MGLLNSVVLYLFSFTVLAACGLCARTSDLIYYDVVTNSSGMCFRRFNATHQIGCSSGRNGNVGVVYYTKDNKTVEELITDGTDAPYVVLMSAELFHITGHYLIKNSDKVSGVVLMPTNDTMNEPLNFSPDTQCPDDRYGAYSGDPKYGNCQSVTWNPLGNGLMFEDIPFPVLSLVNLTIAEFLMNECFQKHNAPAGPDGQPLGQLRCGMLIKDVMDGAKDTPTCIRRSRTAMNLSPQRYCDALGSQNVFSFLRPMHNYENNSVIIVAARYDAFSMFDGQYPGVDSAALSFVTVFAIAEALGRVKEELLNATDRHIMLVLFHGEAFDYIGSSRMVYDLEKGRMNFTLDNIEMFVEIGQMGLHSHQDTVWIHTGVNESAQTSAFKALLKNISAEVNLSLSDVSPNQPLPPASVHSFLKARKNIPGVILTNHEKEFTNRFYNSHFDTAAQSGLVYPLSLNDSERYNYVGDLAVHLQKVSTVVARAVYQLAVGDGRVPPPDSCGSTNTTVANLLYCLTVDPNCELLNSSYASWMVPVLRDPVKFMSRYVGVYDYNSHFGSFNANLFARFLGDVVDNANETTCNQLQKTNKNGYSYYYMQGPVNESSPAQTRTPMCMRAAANVSKALSPAFEIDDYDWSTNQYSSWTESSWGSGDTVSAKIFLMPSHEQEVTTFVIGFIFLITSFALVYVIERRSSILFTPSAMAVSS
jgi:nicastrin